ncbi:MAG: hypothetical protein IT464_04190 [Planctomycetes bacterium]|nr:hypothetical protein [Planctomycetota bacterium]
MVIARNHQGSSRRLGVVLLLAGVASGSLLLLEGAGRPVAAALSGPGVPHLDKLLHAAAHAWLATLFFMGAYLLGKPPARLPRALTCAVLTFALTMLLGTAVELVQAKLGASHGRVFDMWDIAADALGSGLAILFWLVVVWRVSGLYTGGKSGR